MRKLNLATLKFRPVCALSGAKCGLRWFQVGDKSYSEGVVRSGQIKEASTAQQVSVEKGVLDALASDFSEAN